MVVVAFRFFCSWSWLPLRPCCWLLLLTFCCDCCFSLLLFLVVPCFLVVVVADEKRKVNVLKKDRNFGKEAEKRK